MDENDIAYYLLYDAYDDFKHRVAYIDFLQDDIKFLYMEPYEAISGLYFANDGLDYYAKADK